MNKTWRKLKVSKAELQLGPTLGGGQSFRWKNIGDNNWIGVFKNRVWILSQEDNYLLYKTDKGLSSDVLTKEDKNLHEKLEEEEAEIMLKCYFRLDVNLNSYYKNWCEIDPYFKKTAPKLFGIRILNQEVVENIFSFICSSNNNIKRISSMVEKLCDLYGDEIVEVNKETFRSFPTIEKLIGSTVESDLRNAGFGYRARFIHESACLIKKLGGSVWLENLKLLPYQDAKKELMKLPGIGAKVADCICLMSLGHLEAVPIDTHILQIATNIYLPHLKKYKSLTVKVYNEIGDHFRSLHGSYAGWANTVLAKKGSSEEDGNGYEAFQVWSHARPGPKPFKFKGPKPQVIVIGRPQQQPFYPQAPQYSQAQAQVLDPLKIQQFFGNVQRQMQDFSYRAYKKFEMIENEIDLKKTELENTLKSQFQSLERTLEAKQQKEIQEAVKDGKSQEKIEKCLAEEEEDFRADMNADIQRTTDCINDATERARKILGESRNEFTSTSILSSEEAKEYALKVNFCGQQRDSRCVQEGMYLIEDKIKNTVQEGNRQFEKIQDVVQKQMIQLNYCRQNFMEDLKDMRHFYSTMVKRCVIAAEISKPEEDYEEDEEAKNPVEVKPEVEVETGVEINV